MLQVRINERWHTYKSTKHVYAALNTGDGRALYLCHHGWYRVEPYHERCDLPVEDATLHWRSPPEYWETWKADQIISVTLDTKYELRWFVRRQDCTLQRVYERCRAWALAHNIPCDGQLFASQDNQPLDHTQMLLDIYTYTFDIRIRHLP